MHDFLLLDPKWIIFNWTDRTIESTKNARCTERHAFSRHGTGFDKETRTTNRHVQRSRVRSQDAQKSCQIGKANEKKNRGQKAQKVTDQATIVTASTCFLMIVDLCRRRQVMKPGYM
mmetsp:Transcript_235/g.358  ORF Transcript_235/g.358 Transcript_235/m.358 type:complete len:117 (-) Transcript_235:193-543(-)